MEPLRPARETSGRPPADAEESAGRRPADASEADATRMTRALRDGKDGSGRSGQGEKAPGKKTPEGAATVPGGVSSMFSQAMLGLSGKPAPAAEAPIVEQAASRPEAAPASRCGEIVDRILVAQPSADGSQEVRIKIDRPWLPDTEVRLTVASDARLEVEFRSDAAESQRFLLPNLGNLRERLAERTGGEVAVRMSESAGAGGDAGDGRSRNRRNIIEELERE